MVYNIPLDNFLPYSATAYSTSQGCIFFKRFLFYFIWCFFQYLRLSMFPNFNYSWYFLICSLKLFFLLTSYSHLLHFDITVPEKNIWANLFSITCWKCNISKLFLFNWTTNLKNILLCFSVNIPKKMWASLLSIICWKSNITKIFIFTVDNQQVVPIYWKNKWTHQDTTHPLIYQHISMLVFHKWLTIFLSLG